MTALDPQRIRAIAASLTPRTQAFIDGAFRDAASGKSFETINPATGEVIAAVAHCGADDVDLAVKAARRAFDSGVWSRAAPEARKAVLLKLAELVRAHKGELAVLESIDSGKTITDCLHEIGNEVPNFFQWYGELIDKAYGSAVFDTTKGGFIVSGAGGKGVAQRQGGREPVFMRVSSIGIGYRRARPGGG